MFHLFVQFDQNRDRLALGAADPSLRSIRSRAVALSNLHKGCTVSIKGDSLSGELSFLNGRPSGDSLVVETVPIMGDSGISMSRPVR